MARNTPAGARAELFASLPTSGGRLVSGDYNARVFEYELAPQDLTENLALTIFLQRTTARSFDFAVRLWSKVIANGAEAQKAVDVLLPVIEDRISDGFGPNGWTIGWDESFRMIVATGEWSCVREDLSD
jgi:hypothetical protein